MANVIEILLRTQADLSGIKKLTAAFGAGLVLRAFVKNLEEAEDAAAQLDAAFKATGDSVGLTRNKLDELASTIQQTTKFSDALTKQAEAVLLTFTKVRGEAFERTIKVSADLASRMGTDLVTAVRQVGLALQDPERGLIALRRAGVSFDDTQKNLIKNLVDAGRAADAQKVILAELEKRFNGSAAAARGTLSGALAGLKNAFSNLLEGTKESSSETAAAINELTTAITNPKLKEAIDSIISTLAAGATKVIEFAGGIRVLAENFAAMTNGAAAGDIVRLMDQLATAEKLRNSSVANPERLRFFGKDGVVKWYDNAELDKIIKDLQQQIKEALSTPVTSSTGAGKAGAGIIDTAPIITQLEEVNITVKKIVDSNGDLMQEFVDQTKTASQKAASEFIKLNETLTFLRDNKIISEEERVKRRSSALDDLLPEFDLNEIRAKYITLKKATTETGEFIRGAFQSAGAAVRQSFADMFYASKFQLRSLVDVARRAAAEIAAAFATLALKKGLTALGGGGIISSTLALLGGNAGGGKVTAGKPRWVGEEGKKELFVPETTGTIYNQRMLAGAMGGGSITYAPQMTVEVIEREDPEATKREILQVVGIQMSRQQKEFAERLSRNGVGVK